ncbi:hypothetical protein ACIPUD_27945 [Bradyrhizobium sp. CAR08]
MTEFVILTLNLEVSDRAKVRAAALRKYLASGNTEAEFKKYEHNGPLDIDDVDAMKLMSWIDILVLNEMADDPVDGYRLYNTRAEVTTQTPEF